MDEIEADLEELARYSAAARRVFFTGANPFGISNKRLAPILKRVKEVLRHVETIGGFVRIGDLKHKSDTDLEELAVETGYDPALSFMDKGHTAADIVEQCTRLDAAGIRYSFFYLTGIAGKDKGVEAALASAEASNHDRDPLNDNLPRIETIPGHQGGAVRSGERDRITP